MEDPGEQAAETIRLGGSNQYWKTRIPAGGRFEVHDLPKAALPSIEEAARQGLAGGVRAA